MYSYNMRCIAVNGLSNDRALRKEAGFFDSWVKIPKVPVMPTPEYRIAELEQRQIEARRARALAAIDDPVARRRIEKQWMYDDLFGGDEFADTPAKATKPSKKRGGKFKKGLKGTGVAAGVGALGYGGYKAYENYQARKKEEQEQIAALQRFMEEQAAIEDGENTLKSIGIGAGIGGVGGAGLGALLSRENRGRNAFLGGLGGAGAGALAGYLLRNKKLM